MRYGTPTPVQAWEWTLPGTPGGFVYTQQAALDRMAEGADITAVTIVRYPDGSRRYLRGVLADQVDPNTL